MTYVPQDASRLYRRGAGAALVEEALAFASSEIAQTVRVQTEHVPTTLAGFRSDARQVERYLLDLAAERLYDLQTPELIATEAIMADDVDHLLVDPDVLAEELRVDARRRASFDDLALAVSLAIARVADMPEGLGLLETRHTLRVRGTWLALPRRPVADVLDVRIEGIPITDYTVPEPGALEHPDGWGESVDVRIRAGYASPRSEAPMAWRAEAQGELRRNWTTIAAGGFRPANITSGGFQLDHERREEDPDALLRRLSLDRVPLDARAREWLDQVRRGERRLDVAAPAQGAARYVGRRRAPWVNRLYGRSES